MKQVILLCIGTYASMLSFGQAKKIEALSVGSNVPNLAFNKVWGYKNKKASLAEFKGKLVILDFWNTGCTACVAGFPKMSLLQKQFNNNLQIILVNSNHSKLETEDKVKDIIERYKKRTGDSLSMPIALFDTVLNKYFVHRYEPHQVWIKDEKVVAITASEYVSESNIQSVLSGKAVSLPEKNDAYPWDNKIPLLVNGNGGTEESFMFRSLFTKYNRFVPISEGSKATGDVISFYILNKSLFDITLSAFGAETRSIPSMSKNRILLDVNSPIQFSRHDTAYMYCYNVTVPLNIGKYDPFKSLREDLKQFFNIRASQQKKILKSISLQATDTISKSFSKYKSLNYDVNKETLKKFIYGIKTADLVGLLEEHFDVVFVDDTKLDRLVDIDFPLGFKWTKDELFQVLKNAGFAVKEEDRELDVFVITDK